MNSSDSNSGSVQITASAPGKLVLSGEYAVLEGGPAIVAAVNRRARVTLQTGTTEGWTFTGSLDRAPYSVNLAQMLTDPLPAPTHPTFLATHVVRTLHNLRQPPSWPEHLHVTMDTTPLFDANGSKLGLGSSAALCTALAGAFAELLHLDVSLADIVAMHQQCQGGKGSGLDVAAAHHGGVIEYRLGDNRTPISEAFTMTGGLHFAYYWTGVSASTSAHLDRLQGWLDANPPTAMRTLVEAANSVAGGGFTMADLDHFASALYALDCAAELGIYAGSHDRLQALAKGHQVVYKPCGAGGGDLGLAASSDPTALNAYTEAALRMGVRAIALETDPNGLIVYRS